MDRKPSKDVDGGKKSVSRKKTVRVKGESNDHLYFTVIPRIVWAMSDDNYDYTLWGVIRDIAGENGECILARDELALLAMMSTGQTSTSLQRLISKGLILGDLRKDPGYPQKVWHLRVPDLWAANVVWARKYASLKDRVQYKREQKVEIQSRRKTKLCESCGNEFSPLGRRDKQCAECRHRMTVVQSPSPDDGGLTPDDGGLTPDDVKKNQKEDLKRKTIIRYWNSVIEQLKNDMPRSSFDDYVRDTKAIGLVGDTLTIWAPTDYACNWLEERLSSTVTRLLVGIMNRSVDVSFVTGNDGWIEDPSDKESLDVINEPIQQ